jgi:hypothetical protein
VAGDTGALPQVSWLGIKEGVVLAIHGKRVELAELQSLASTLLRDARTQLDSGIKMGIRSLDWAKFEPEDDLMNTVENYSFVTSRNNDLIKDKMYLLHTFIANEVTRSFFSRGMNGNNILWRKNECMKWLRRCQKFVETLAVLCHLLGGQPARGSEFITLRWRNAIDEQRGVYWVNGSVILLAIYSKTRSITRKNKLIPR